MKKLISSLCIALTLATAAGACGGDSKGGGKVGVAACDDYLDKLETCATKVGGDLAKQLRSTRSMMLGAWKKDASSKTGKDGLQSSCEWALGDIKKQVAQCDW
jgi:hypothetical protein